MSDCNFLVLQKPVQWQEPVLIKDHHNNNESRSVVSNSLALYGL